MPLDAFSWSTVDPPSTGGGAGPRVSLRQGTIVGSALHDGAVEAFRGIPYALPPVGDRRFRPAQPVPASRETVDATRFGARCVFSVLRV